LTGHNGAGQTTRATMTQVSKIPESRPMLPAGVWRFHMGAAVCSRTQQLVDRIARSRGVLPWRSTPTACPASRWRSPSVEARSTNSNWWSWSPNSPRPGRSASSEASARPGAIVAWRLTVERDVRRCTLASGPSTNAPGSREEGLSAAEEGPGPGTQNRREGAGGRGNWHGAGGRGRGPGQAAPPAARTSRSQAAGSSPRRTSASAGTSSPATKGNTVRVPRWAAERLGVLTSS
jgi:hypothetical protein